MFATLAGMKYQAILFDLDGTLLDTLEDLTCACNHVVTLHDKKPITVPECKKMVGNGARVLLNRLTGLEGAGLDEALKLFLTYYNDHKFDHTGPYPDIPELLDGLVERELRLAILSNKPHPATMELSSQIFNRWPFEHVFGQRDGVPLKPDPTAAIDICKLMGVEPQQCVFVGDSGEDMATGKAAGMLSVGVTWGFRPESALHENGADAVIHEPMGLLRVIDGA